MKKVFKVLGIIVLLIVLLVFASVGYVKFFLPNVGDAPELTIQATPERIARGEYLANSVCVCMDCHSTRDWSKFSGPLKEGTFGVGGERFDRNMGFPGVFYSKNITPYGVGDWTDGELFRVITTGVDKNGDAIFPVMPYKYYGKMAKEDIYSIIAYIRTLDPVESTAPPRELDFPLNIVLNLEPVNAEPQAMPQPEDRVAYGKYLTNASGCIECHTQADDKGHIYEDLAFSGGRAFELPGGTLRSANITPHNTGISYLDEDQFIVLFKKYQDSSYQVPSVNMTDYNSIMPWMMYSAMSERDLRAIYAYLQTVKPMENQVTKFSPRTAKK